MSGKATVLFVKETGHIVAALTKAADGAESSKEQLVSSEFLMRRLRSAEVAGTPDGLEFHLDVASLGTAQLDQQLGLLKSPRSFAIDDPNKPTVIVALPTSGTTQINLEVAGSTLVAPTFDGKSLTVQFANNHVVTAVTEKLSIWAQVEFVDAMNNRRSQHNRADIAVGDKTATVTFADALPRDGVIKYAVLVLVGMMRPYADKL
jgi:hypothetical protein